MTERIILNEKQVAVLAKGVFAELTRIMGRLHSGYLDHDLTLDDVREVVTIAANEEN